MTTVVGAGAAVLTAASAPAWLATAGRRRRPRRDPRRGPGRAAGEDPARVAGATPPCVHGRAATLASAGGPLAALDVADAVPAALTSLPGWLPRLPDAGD